MFAATQALGWALFSYSLLNLVYLIVAAAKGVAYCLRCWLFATGSVMLASQLVRLPWGIPFVLCGEPHSSVVVYIFLSTH
jgi:hypothetical protein